MRLDCGRPHSGVADMCRTRATELLFVFLVWYSIYVLVGFFFFFIFLCHFCCNLGMAINLYCVFSIKDSKLNKYDDDEVHCRVLHICLSVC